MNGLREYVSQLAEMEERHGWGRGLNTILRDHGVEFTWSVLPEGEEYGWAKQCYGNAGTRVLLGNGFDPDPNLTYYEGLVSTGLGAPIPHAWAADREGRVLELTLRHNDSDCPYCHGDGELHPRDHYDYDGTGEEFEDDAETIDCEMCDGTGDWEPVDRTGTTYIGIPIETDLLRKAVQRNGVWGVLNNATGDLLQEILNERS